MRRREWEGATLRNSGTRANNLLPLRGREVPEAAYAAAVATFWEHLPISASFRTRSPGAKAAGLICWCSRSVSDAALSRARQRATAWRSPARQALHCRSRTNIRTTKVAIVTPRPPSDVDSSVNADKSAQHSGDCECAGDVGVATRVAMVAADLACLLQRFALRQSFSADAGGGGRASNARLVPGLVQLGRHLLASASGDALAPLETALAQLSAAAPITDGKVAAAVRSP